MKKKERLDAITQMVKVSGTLKVQDIIDELSVSDMTVRRDLSELEKKGVLIRTHGGAKSNHHILPPEQSHREKSLKHVRSKKSIAQYALSLIEEGDTVFLGPGTTIELLAQILNTKRIRIVTNCLPVFSALYPKRTEHFKVFLLGGELRDSSQSFVGEMANTIMEKLHFNKTFFSGNGVKRGEVMTSSFEEAYIQQQAIYRSTKSYLLLDHTKVGVEDFTSICTLSQVHAVITDSYAEGVDEELRQYTSVIQAQDDNQ